MKNLFFLLIVLLFTNCIPDSDNKDIPSFVYTNYGNNENEASYSYSQYLVNTEGKTVKTRFTPPSGYKRVDSNKMSFAYYLQTLPLKPDGAVVKQFDGKEKYGNDVYCAVVDMDIGNRDLQQCADAVMRLRAEYLYKMKKYNQIHFNFTNGFRVDYDKWRQGNRIAVNGNNTSWVHKTEPDNSYQSFREYLNWIFMYAGSLSLSRELKPVNYKDMQIGDVLIHGGSPGHAVIVIDMAINSKTKEKVYLLAQSYMPAQDIHVLINPDFLGISPWYKLDPNESIVYTPEWEFYTYELMRF